jgi:putative peptide zinc metalloprotease protein
MNPPGQCVYPPRPAEDVEIVPCNDGARATFIVGSAAAGRYLILGETENRILQLLDGSRTPSAVWGDLAELTPFLSKLDEVGILAGERAGRPQQALLPGSQVYLCWKLFNPDRLFQCAIPKLRWIWTPWFFSVSLLLMTAVALLTLVNWPEVSRYATQTLRQHYLTVLLVAWLVTVTHEFAHGLTSKAFGGRATEIGVLLIYYFLPALYCNVSGLHMIPQRWQRLWVIAAGIYWQLLVGAVSLASWFVFHPDTLLGHLAMAFVVGSLLDLVFNANPLIKLDGYYFLSQWLGIPNLMDRSRAVWCGARFSGRERRILLVFGLLSFLYNLALPVAIVWYTAQYLMDRFQFLGLLFGLLLGLSYAWQPLKKLLAGGEGKMTKSELKGWGVRRFVPAVAILGFVVALCLPWKASVGGYGMLVPIPGREAIIRAPENASLIVLNVQPGQQVERGMTIGRMGNLDLEEQITQVRTELARVSADAGRLAGELRVQQETASTSEWQLAQRRREFQDIDAEERQIRARLEAVSQIGLVLASYVAPALRPLPAALEALETDADRLQAKLANANRDRDRDGGLYAEGLIARSQLEAAEGKSATLAFDWRAARERLQAAVVEHQRRHGSAETALNVADSGRAAAKAQEASLGLQLEGAKRLSESLGERLALLERKRSQFELLAPLTGTLYGEDLPRMAGQYFTKGAEICRIARTGELLVRVQVAEQAVGDIAPRYAVRLKTRAFPDRVFHGVVSKIGGESEMDANGQRSYRVELTIQNEDGLLRPGMTVFARVDFGRRMIIWLAAHKLKQALRPEMWML